MRLNTESPQTETLAASLKTPPGVQAGGLEEAAILKASPKDISSIP